MNAVRNWLLPVTLAVAQVAYWPRDLTPQPSQYPALLGILIITVALGWRRRRPLIALAGAAAGLTLGVLTAPEDAVVLMEITDMIALYSVAAREPRRTWLAALGALAVWQLVCGAFEYGFGSEYVAESGMTLLCYVLIAGCGVARKQWLAGREQAAEALRRAESARQEAGDGERRRLSTELHDVSAHHLTSIVVTMNAARRLARPELVDDSLRLAADTGRAAQAELRRLLTDSALPAETPLAERLNELADAFTRLGQRVRVEGAGSVGVLPPAVAELAHALVREALTNTVRYAPGADVGVRLSLSTTDADAGQLRVVVENGPGTGAPADAGRLGSGRGLAGLRRRTQLLGGTWSAGPADGGRWQVEATMLTTARGSSRWRHGFIDLGVVALMLGLPVGAALLPDPSPPLDLRSWLLLAVVVPVHAVPLLYRRRAPWVAWAAVFVTVALWPTWLLGDWLPPSERMQYVAMFGACADVVAVYAVGAHARRKWPSLLVVPASSVALGTTFAVGTAVYGWQDSGGWLFLPLLVGLFAACWLVPVAVVWAVGFAVRIRRDRIVGREDGAVGAAVAAAEAEARAERARLVAGLRDQVLQQTDRVVTAAEQGDPDQVLAAARAALAAMRDLLTALDPPASAPALAASA
ncbi:sensor histidine kinase [Cryptosporangium phraense]|uniref:histidine kinase n=1 Tax=Cryptosporangium phraense TaxID=2593070 RepID=A0A545AZ21_9ACTN|nr:histidine kinase [Cryptosporangium phraense]TQS46586.1 histidine kinase [Cryptosporangium phraense]